MFLGGSISEDERLVQSKSKGGKLSCLGIICLLVMLLLGCSPKGYGAVKKELTKALDVNFKCIQEKVSEEEAIYTFRDENGLEFSYQSVMVPVSIDGSTFGNTARDYCDYALRYITHNAGKIKERCAKYDLEVEFVFSKNENLIEKINIHISKYEHVKAAAQLIADLFADNCIPLKAKTDSLPIPQIKVYCNGSFCTTYDFFCNYDEEMSEADLYADLLPRYAAMAKNREIPNDLPQDLREQVPPQYIKTVYINGCLADEKVFRGFHDLSFYYDKTTQRYSEIFVIGYTTLRFEEILSMVGFTYSYDFKDVGKVKWEKPGLSYLAVLTEDEEELIIYRNGQECSRVKVSSYSEYPEQIYFKLDTKQLEELLDLEVSIDIENAVITMWSKDRLDKQGLAEK